MDNFIAWLGGVGILMGVLTAWSSWDRRRMRRIIIDTCLELGLVRYHREGGHEVPRWPGEHDTLPDALEGIWAEMRSHHA